MGPYYFRGQGRVLIAERDTSGNPLVFREAGDISAFTITPSSTAVTHNEHKTGNSLEDSRFYHSQKAEVEMDFDEWDPEDLALSLWGSTSAIAGSTVSGETVQGSTTLTVGDVYTLAHANVSSVVITDSAGAPATLAAGTDYTLDATFGSLKLLNAGSYTAPLKAAYTYGAATDMGMMVQKSTEKFVRFEGKNSNRAGNAILATLYRVTFAVSDGLALMGDTYSTHKLKGGVLYDSARPVDPTLGQFGTLKLI